MPRSGGRIHLQNRIRKISAVFHWKVWAGETDVRLTMDALVTHRAPKTGEKHTALLPPLKQFVIGSDKVQICAFAYSPDGRRLVIGEFGATLYDAGTWNQLAKLGGDPVCGVSFSPDNSTVATAGWTGGRVRLWNPATGDGCRPSRPGRSGCAILRFPSRRPAVDRRHGTRRHGLGPGHRRAGGAEPGRRGPNRSRLRGWPRCRNGSKKGAILLYDLRKNQPVRTLPANPPNRNGIFAAPSLAFSPNGKWIAIGDNWHSRQQNGEIDTSPGRPSLVRVFEVETGALARLVIRLERDHPRARFLSR